ncbi:possible Vanadium/alternative nitrogenase delt [Prochlorococcus marinus str. MIT 9515]|uniref:Possible Vanadium/alternative nitrogenase delt n=1 Tax=Prochlorococcus marinus (strain MIT 9515) TaxID=167542 RepID=A2BVX1_PROM5|nr:hypothetical protein [Prochlorococcus marinus]ABM71932.1 possible Vanadium/alternative nitrogenase delt [Prochlorococcus marinus str. MIT 9515]
MWELEKIAKVLKHRIIKSEEELDNKPSILFCGMDSYQKRGLHSEAKKVGFKPVYSMKHPSIKVVMQKSSSRKIETDKFKTITIDIEHFWYLCRKLL